MSPTTCRSLGYRGTRKDPRTTSATPVTKPVKDGDGDVPTVLLDAGGTAHVAWDEIQVHNETPALHYCRLRRGATSCDNPKRDFPRAPVYAYVSDDGGTTFQEGVRVVHRQQKGAP